MLHNDNDNNNNGRNVVFYHLLHARKHSPFTYLFIYKCPTQTDRVANRVCRGGARWSPPLLHDAFSIVALIVVGVSLLKRQYNSNGAPSWCTV